LNQGIDIRLGDIAVSQPSGISGGVVQYDFGKARPGDRFKRIGFLNSLPQPILTALAALQAQHEFGSGVPDLLKEMTQKHPQLKIGTVGKSSYTYQGEEHDKLFRGNIRSYFGQKLR
jgi:hypothetical protein